MIAYLYVSDMTGCGFNRLLWPAGVLQEQGYDVRVILPGQETHMGGIMQDGHMIDAACPPDADVIVLQRPCNRKLAEMVPLLVAKGVTVVVEVDDDLAHIDPRNPAFWALHPSKNPDVNWSHLAYACREASLVTVSTPALAKVYGAHGRVRILENLVPASLLERERVDADWVGWPGLLATHPGDLDDVRVALDKLRRDGAEFRVVGNPEGVGKALGWAEDPPGTGVVAFEDWSAEVAKIGVGIAPLADTRFNAGKSWLRVLQLSALGVPWVGSDLPEQRRLADMGAGQVVNRRDWFRALKALVGSSDMRDDWSGRGRAAVAGMTYEKRAYLWWEAWSDAVTTKQARQPLRLMT